MLIEVTDFHAF